MRAMIDPMHDYDMVVVHDGVQNTIGAAVSAPETLQITFEPTTNPGRVLSKGPIHELDDRPQIPRRDPVHVANRRRRQFDAKRHRSGSLRGAEHGAHLLLRQGLTSRVLSHSCSDVLAHTRL